MNATTTTNNLSASAICDALRGLVRIEKALSTAEQMTRRKWTQGREAEVLRDLLDGFDATQIRRSQDVGVNLWEIALQASDRIGELVSAWPGRPAG